MILFLFCSFCVPVDECIICQIVDIILAISYDDMVQFYQFKIIVVKYNYLWSLCANEHTGI